MRQYLEVEEIVGFNEPFEFIRVDITDKTDAEIQAIWTAIEDIMKGKTYRLTRHDCGHDEGKSCVMVEI